MAAERNTSGRSAHPVRILIVDDMPHVRQELRTLLPLTSDVVVIGEAADGAEAIAQAELLHPDVIVMDLEMPVLNGIAATREIKRRGLGARIIMLSIHTDAVTGQQVKDAGADALVDKAAHFENLIRVLAA